MNEVEALFEDLERLQADRKLPPVQRWHPERVGRLDLRITRDGRWLHEGTEIRRQALVNLFATVLRLDADGYCLVTPAEKLLIEVEDAPFVAVDMELKGQGRESEILFTTNVGDHVVADPEHPLRVAEQPSPAGPPEPHPYLLVRDGLEALLSRSLFYRLVEHAAVQEGSELVVYSRGGRFCLGRV